MLCPSTESALAPGALIFVAKGSMFMTESMGPSHWVFDVDDDANRIQAVERECLDRPRLALLELTSLMKRASVSPFNLLPRAIPPRWTALVQGRLLFRNRRVLGADHFDGRSVLVELIEGGLVSRPASMSAA